MMTSDKMKLRMRLKEAKRTGSVWELLNDVIREAEAEAYNKERKARQEGLNEGIKDLLLEIFDNFDDEGNWNEGWFFEMLTDKLEILEGFLGSCPKCNAILEVIYPFGIYETGWDKTKKVFYVGCGEECGFETKAFQVRWECVIEYLKALKPKKETE